MSAGTTRRAIRISDGLWTQALAVAHDRGDNLSTIMRKSLERYVARHTPKDTK